MKYAFSEEWTSRAREIAQTLELNHIPLEKVTCIKSFGAKTRAYARIHGMPKAFQIGMEINPCYVIELLSEKFDKLDEQEKIKTIIHELLHIPHSFGGGFRNHRQYVRSHHVNSAFEKYRKQKQEF